MQMRLNFSRWTGFCKNYVLNSKTYKIRQKNTNHCNTHLCISNYSNVKLFKYNYKTGTTILV